MRDFFVNVRSGDLTRSYIIVALLIVVGLAIVFFTTFVQQAEYQIPIQYTEIGSRCSNEFILTIESQSSWCYSCYLC